MPLVKRHDTLTDLIKKGAEKKQSLHDERRRQSAYYAGWTLQEKPESIAYDEKGAPRVDPEEKDKLLPLSSFALWVVEMQFIKYTRFIALIGAFIILTVDASTNPEEVGSLLHFIYPLDYVVNVYYIIDGVVKMVSMYAYISIARNCSQLITMTTYCRRSGIIDVPLSVFCLIYRNDTAVNKWLHLVRCMALSLFFLEQTPQIDVLMSGITAGLRSTLYTWSLMFLIFLVYAATGVIFFKDNDPYHFGNIGMAMWSYFEMTTLDNWSDVLNINYYGCKDFSADYYEPGDRVDAVKTDYGTFYLPVCSSSKPRPLVSSVLFTFFILMCGFVMVSLTVAFVTTGINNKLRTLKEEEDQLELLVEQGRAPMKEKVPLKKRRKSIVQRTFQKGKDSLEKSFSKSSIERISFASNGFITRKFGSKDSESSDSSAKLKRDASNASMDSTDSTGGTGGTGVYSSIERARRALANDPPSSSNTSKNIIADPDLLRALLMQVWKNDEGDSILLDEPMSGNLKRRRGVLLDQKKVGKFNAVSFKRTMKDMHKKPNQRSDWMKWLMQVGVHMRNVVGNKYYIYGVSGVIVIAAVVQLLTVEESIDTAISDLIGILCQVAFTFDLVFKFLSHAPKYKTFFENSWNVFDAVLVFFLWIPILAVGAPNLVYFELLKIMRIIRVLKIFSWIIEVNIIMKSISTSARCLAYVVFLMIVFFYHFGVAGVYLFSRNDPFHFGNIGKALITLFQVSTLDDWSDIARMNMYGCMYIGYDPVYCDEHDSYGWGWVAAWYFIVFVIVGVMVLVALFVGVIITSMELLQLSIREEAEMLSKVATKQAEFGITDTCAHTLLEIFDMIDVCANGRLTLHELKPILGMVSLKESQQYELFHKIDEDMSGKIDFAEFVELIHLMNVAFSQKTKNAELQRKSSNSLRRFLTPTGSGKGTMLGLISQGFNKKKKSLKTVAKLSIVASRLSNVSKGSKGEDVHEVESHDGIENSLSRLSEDSEESAKTTKSVQRMSSKGWRTMLGQIKSVKEEGAVEYEAPALAVAVSEPASDISPNLKGQWFGGSASIIPDNGEDAVVAFRSSGSNSRGGSPVVGKISPVFARRTDSPLTDLSKVDVDRSDSDERHGQGPGIELGTFRGSNGAPPARLSTFNMADTTSSTPMVETDNESRPFTSDGSQRKKLSPGIQSAANGKGTGKGSDSIGSPLGVSAPRRRFKSPSKPKPAKPPTAEPNLFFNYADSAKEGSKSSDQSARGSPEVMHL